VRCNQSHIRYFVKKQAAFWKAVKRISDSGGSPHARSKYYEVRVESEGFRELAEVLVVLTIEFKQLEMSSWISSEYHTEGSGGHIRVT
jgi:hypothetical protein